MSGEQIPALKRRAYRDQVFCWIENGETEKVKKFIDMYESHAKQFTTMNNWSLPMFACRYGNLELLQYLAQKKFTLDGAYQYTLVHAACFGNELEVLRYLIDVMKKEPVPHNEQQPPLKICFKAENQQLSELLISRGAYFQYNSFCHNVRVETVTTAPSGVAQNKYKTVQRIRNEVVEIDVPSSLVFTRQNISQESSMLQFLRFVRIKNFMHARKLMDSPNLGGIVDERKKENFSSLLKIAFEKDPNYNSQARILEFLVGKKEVKENVSNPSQVGTAQDQGQQNQQGQVNNTNNVQSFQNQQSQGNQYAAQSAQLPTTQQGQQPMPQ